jgi:hypothetical protein
MAYPAERWRNGSSPRLRGTLALRDHDVGSGEWLAGRFSGQSGRVGFVVAAKQAGAADTAIAATRRHKSLQMIKRYGEAADQRRCAPHQLKSVGL